MKRLNALNELNIQLGNSKCWISWTYAAEYLSDNNLLSQFLHSGLRKAAKFLRKKNDSSGVCVKLERISQECYAQNFALIPVHIEESRQTYTLL